MSYENIYIELDFYNNRVYLIFLNNKKTQLFRLAFEYNSTRTSYEYTCEQLPDTKFNIYQTTILNEGFEFNKDLKQYILIPRKEVLR